MKTLKTIMLLCLFTLCLNVTSAQETYTNEEPMASIDYAVKYVPSIILAAADQMPEEFYSFKPTPEIRDFRGLMVHIVESNFYMVAMAKEEMPPAYEVGPTKADVIKALEASFEYAEEARNSLTEEDKAKMIEFMDGTKTVQNVLDFSVFHTLQHYGNVIVYMRLKGLVPPSPL